MASTKSSSTAKKTTAPRKPRAPKPVERPNEEPASKPVSIEPVAVTSKPKPAPAATEPNPYEKIRIYIPIDPSVADAKQYVEGSVNGKFFRLQRGKEHMVERYLAEHIERRLRYNDELMEYIEKVRYKD